MEPEDADQFEHCVEVIVREQARSFVEWYFNSQEPQKVDAIPQPVEYLGQKYRRLRQKTRHASVLTRSGNITLSSATWRQGSLRRTITPLSAYCYDQCLGTLYLAAASEDDQKSLSQNFTSLLTSIVSTRCSKPGRIVYVSDAGKIETAYWQNVLRHLHVDGQRIRIQRVVDYYHASLRLTTIADALPLTTSLRTEWLQRVRKLPLETGGWGRVMRSIA